MPTEGELAREVTMGDSEDNPTAPANEAPRYGPTVAAHIELLLQRSFARVADVSARIEQEKRLSVAEREELSRSLAGVIANCEAIRIWLAAGAPR